MAWEIWFHKQIQCNPNFTCSSRVRYLRIMTTLLVGRTEIKGFDFRRGGNFYFSTKSRKVFFGTTRKPRQYQYFTILHAAQA